MACSNVTSDHCEAPANLEGVTSPRTKCWGCGQPVCGPCSSMRTTRATGRRRVRICDRCLTNETDGEAKVLLRRYQQAGDTHMDLARCRAEIARNRAALASAALD